MLNSSELSDKHLSNTYWVAGSVVDTKDTKICITWGSPKVAKVKQGVRQANEQYSVVSGGLVVVNLRCQISVEIHLSMTAFLERFNRAGRCTLHVGHCVPLWAWILAFTS